MDLVALHGVAQRAHDRLLADDLLERARPVPAIQRLLLLLRLVVGHRVLSLPTGGALARSRDRGGARGALDCRPTG